MILSWLSLLPPLIVIATIIITHQLNISLTLGIIVASFIATHGAPYQSAVLIIDRFKAHFTDINNVYLYFALIAISSLITLLTVTGSAAACAHIMSKKVRSKKGAQISSILLSFLLSIDDYLSILTVGFVMRPLVDKLAVARAKLAYLIHSLAGPLVIIMPLSTWAATILAQLDNAGINLDATGKISADPFYVYLKTIPFMFYSSLTIICVIFVVYCKISYGPLAKLETDVVVTSHTDQQTRSSDHNHTIIEVIMPITILIGGVIVGILYAGKYYLFGGNNSFFGAFAHNDQTFFILLIAGLAAFIASTLLALAQKMISFADIPRIIMYGITLMHGPIIMVILASILGSFLRTDLQTGNYIASLLLGRAPLYCIPVILFITSLAITLATGSAWGTFALLIPITTQMLISFLQLEPPLSLNAIAILFPTLGALLSGASCGDHISPVSETTIMAATSTGTSSLIHAQTQFFYALPVIVGAALSFLVSGILWYKPLYINCVTSIGCGIVVSLSLLTLFNALLKK